MHRLFIVNEVVRMGDFIELVLLGLSPDGQEEELLWRDERATQVLDDFIAAGGCDDADLLGQAVRTIVDDDAVVYNGLF